MPKWAGGVEGRSSTAMAEGRVFWRALATVTIFKDFQCTRGRIVSLREVFLIHVQRPPLTTDFHIFTQDGG